MAHLIYDPKTNELHGIAPDQEGAALGLALARDVGVRCDVTEVPDAAVDALQRMWSHTDPQRWVPLTALEAA